MARQECSNTFSDGLMMDLNPINTPKSVLTDCLNGTYITYNGNEFVLQNDMGNYKLKNCKLPTNFIPVGVKGYGDILYIVSYNPITNETEIGSYPAPQSIFTTGDSEELLAQENDLAPFVIKKNENGKTEVEYPTIIRTNKKPIFIFAGTDKETYKLNPGDEFKFSGELTPPAFIYQHLNFYIIDEDNKLYDIDDTQIYNENGSLVSSDTMRKVFWETPGWLAAQYDLYVPDKFNLNLRSLNVPEFLTAKSNNGTSQADGKPLDELESGPNQFKVSMDLSSQTIITDKLFQTELDKNFGHDNPELNLPWSPNPTNVYDHLYIRYLIKQNQNPPEKGEDDYGTFKGIVVSLNDGTHTKDYTNGVTEGDYVYYDIPVWKHNYQDDIITAYNNIRPIWFCNNPETLPNSEDLDIANYHGVVELTAYPIIKYNGLTLKYTQFSTTQRFPLNTLKNSSDITIADQIYKWSVDDDSCTISFNINGPFINASNITGRYEIYRINLFKNPPADQWNPDEAISSLEDPESYSKWTGLSKTVNAGIEGVWKKPENEDKERFVERSIDKDTDFIEQTKVLMCKGDLSNLVLYGQNTINIDWSSSNKYELTGYQNWYTNPDHTEEDGTKNWFIEDTSYIGYENQTKTIDFSKEGGIYIFRVILEQNGNLLAESRQVLIPSEVFNEWFGSIDNYNNIIGTQWVQNWWNLLNISSLIINSLSIDFANFNGTQAKLLDGWFLYKWNSEIKDYKPLTRDQLIEDGLINSSSDENLTFIQLLEIVFNNKFPNNSEITNIGTKDQTFKWIASNSFIQDTFLFQIDYNKFEKTITSSLSLNNTSLNGNLWNLKQKININLKQNSNKLGISINYSKENNIIEFNNKFSDLISSIDNKKFVTGYTEWIYPFIKSIETTSGINIQSQDYNDERHTPINIDKRPGTRAITHHNYFKLRQTVDDPNNNMANDFYNNLNNSQLLYYPVYLDAAHGGVYSGIYHKIYIGYGSDINGSGYQDLATYDSGPEWKPMFVIKSLNSNNTRFTIVHVGEKMEDLKTFFTILCGMKFRNKTPEQKEYHFPVWSLQQNIPTEAVYTSNKFDVVNKLNYLFADDWYLIQNKNIDINNITSFLLTFTNSIPKEKTQYNLSLSSSININLNYKDNAEYNANIQSLNTIITDSYYTNWITSLENDTIIDFTSDVEILKSDIGSDSITFFNGITTSDINIDTIANTNRSLTDAQKEYFITLFGTTKNGENYSEKTICFNNSKEFELRGARCHESYGGGLRNNCGVISIAYYQKQDAINITI